MTMDQIQEIAIQNNVDVPNLSNKNKLLSKIIDELPYPKQTINLEDLRQISIDHNLPFSDAISLNENIENFRHVNLLQDVGRNEKSSNYCSMDESLLLKQYLFDEEIENSDVPIAHSYEFINVLKEDSFYTTGLFIQNGIVNNVQFVFDIDKYFQELDDATLPCECDIEFFRTLDKNNPVPYGTAKGKMISRSNGILTIEYKNHSITYPIEKLKDGDFSNMSFFVFPAESKQFRFNKKKLLSNNISFHSKLFSTEFIHTFVSMTIFEYLLLMKPKIPDSLHGMNQFLKLFDTDIYNINYKDFRDVIRIMKNNTHVPTKKTNIIYQDTFSARPDSNLTSTKGCNKIIQLLEDEKKSTINYDFIDNQSFDFEKKFQTLHELEAYYTDLIASYRNNSEASKDGQRNFTTYDELVDYKSKMAPYFDSMTTKQYNSRLLRLKSLHHNSDMLISSYKTFCSHQNLFEKLTHDRQNVCSEMTYQLKRSKLLGDVSPFENEMTTDNIGQHAPIQVNHKVTLTDVHLYFKLLKIKPDERVIQHINKQIPNILDVYNVIKQKRKLKNDMNESDTNVCICVGFVCILVYLRICKVSHNDKTFHSEDEGWIWSLENCIAHFSNVMKNVFKNKSHTFQNTDTNKTHVKGFILIIKQTDKLLDSLLKHHTHVPKAKDKSNVKTMSFKPLLTPSLYKQLKETRQRDLYNKKTLIHMEPMVSYKHSIPANKSNKRQKSIDQSNIKNLKIQKRDVTREEKVIVKSEVDKTIKQLFAKDPTFKKMYEQSVNKLQNDFFNIDNSYASYHLILPNLPFQEAYKKGIVSNKQLDTFLEKLIDNDQDNGSILMKNIHQIYTVISDEQEISSKSKNQNTLKEIVDDVFNTIVLRYNESLKNNFAELSKHKIILQENERQKKFDVNSTISDDEWVILKELQKRGIEPNNSNENVDSEVTFVESVDDE